MSKENVHYVDAALYDSVAEESDRNAARTAPSDFPRREMVESVLYQEARLLDDRRYESWLELLTDDCLYWVPATLEPADQRREAAVNFDDRRRLLDRIALIRSGYLHAQNPPTRTCRMITNVETWDRKGGALDVRSCLAIWAYRQGGLTHFVGSQEHVLVARGGRWLIRKKVIKLLDCDKPLGNISFIL